MGVSKPGYVVYAYSKYAIVMVCTKYTTRATNLKYTAADCNDFARKSEEIMCTQAKATTCGRDQ
jgi:hypothetical protein